MRGVPVPKREEDFTADPAELFFDLSFVFAFSRLVLHLVEHATWTGLGEFALLFTLIWLAWANFAWTSNAIAGNSRVVRAIFMVATAISVPMGAAIPSAYDGGGKLFAVTLGVLMVMPLTTTLVLLAGERDVVVSALRVFAPVLSAVTLIVAGGFVEGDGRVWLWIASLVVMGVATSIGGSGEWIVRPGHFAERHGLIVIVALGEVIVAIAVPVIEALSHDDSFGRSLTVALVAAGAFAGLMWWSYFDRPLPALEHRHHQIDDVVAKGRFALDIYTLGHFPIVAGILLAAAGIEEMMLHPDAAVPSNYRLMLFGGLALYNAGVVSTVFRAFSALAIERLALVVLTAALLSIGRDLSGATLLVSLDVLLLAGLVLEHIRFPTGDATQATSGAPAN